MYVTDHKFVTVYNVVNTAGLMNKKFVFLKSSNGKSLKIFHLNIFQKHRFIMKVFPVDTSVLVEILKISDSQSLNGFFNAINFRRKFQTGNGSKNISMEYNNYSIHTNELNEFNKM